MSNGPMVNGQPIPPVHAEPVVSEVFLPPGVRTYASPSVLAATIEQLLMQLPSGWSVTGLEMTRAEGRHVVRMTSEPVLINRVWNLEREAREAHKTADAAAHAAGEADKAVAGAIADYESRLDNARPPADGGPKTVQIAGFDVDPRRVVVND